MRESMQKHAKRQDDDMDENSFPAENTRARKKCPNHKKVFFKTKADHGFAKRGIVHKILQPFFRRHFCNGYRTICYTDTCAGEGTYEKLVGEDFQRTSNIDVICKYGSPLIAQHNIQNTFMSIERGLKDLEWEKDISKRDLLNLERTDEDLLSRLAEGRGAWKRLRPPLQVMMVLIEPDGKRLKLLKSAMKERDSVDSDYDHSIMKYKAFYLCTTLAEATPKLEKKVLNATHMHPITGLHCSIPTFSFIDPFGYKQIPMDIIAKYIGDNKTAVINVMIGFMNRFKSVPSQADHITALFGSERWRKLPEGLENGAKYLWYAKLYEQQLKKRGAKFTLSMAMKDKWNCLRYYVIFATNELKILKDAKESFNRVTQESNSFAFSAYYVKTNQKQLVWSNDQNPNDVAELIWNKYKGCDNISVEKIADFVFTSDTPYVHRKEPLKILWKAGKVSYSEGSTPRGRGTFPDHKGVFLDFASDKYEARKIRYLQNPANQMEEAAGIWHKYNGERRVAVSTIKPKWKKSLKILKDKGKLSYSSKSAHTREGCFPSHALLNFAPKKS